MGGLFQESSWVRLRVKFAENSADVKGDRLASDLPANAGQMPGDGGGAHGRFLAIRAT
jgi:hypothetical protein